MIGISEKQLKKRVIFFGLEDVLVPGRVDESIDLKEVQKILSKISGLAKKFKGFHIVLITGYSEKKAKEKIKHFGLGKFFPPEKIFWVTQKYIDSKADIDKQLYLQKIKKDPCFKDEYFKQKIIQEIGEKLGARKEEMLFICHDVWSEGFYTRRFSGIDFALISSAHSRLDKKEERRINGLTYIERKWADVRELLIGKKPKPSYEYLDNYVHDTIKEEFFGDKLEKLGRSIVKRG